jgi:hypothetical protein
VRPRRSAAGLLTGAALADDPILYTGGGTTELELDLLFDVTLSGSSAPTVSSTPTGTRPPPPVLEDVRVLTGPLRQLAEGSAAASGESAAAPPVVRLVWGKSWNIPGVIVALAERFEYFTAQGSPQRSWLRMRLLRVAEPMVRPAIGSTGTTMTMMTATGSEVATGAEGVPADQLRAHEVLGAGGNEPASERIDEVARRYFGRPAAWRFLSLFNGLDDPSSIPPGTLLRIPQSSVREELE